MVVKWLETISTIIICNIKHIQTAKVRKIYEDIFKNEDLVDFFDFGWLDMLDIAYYDSTNCS